MLQMILTIIIVFSAVLITLIRIVKFFTLPSGPCNGCSHHSAGCSLEELKNQIKIKNTATLTESS